MASRCHILQRLQSHDARPGFDNTTVYDAQGCGSRGMVQSSQDLIRKDLCFAGSNWQWKDFGIPDTGH